MFEDCILGLQQIVYPNLFDVNTFLSNHANSVSRFVHKFGKKRQQNKIELN